MTENITGERRYLLTDGLGSVRQAVDENGKVVARYDYDPYGNPIEDENKPYGFTGEWWESDLGLLHLRARWYMPEVGIFLTRDLWQGDYKQPLTLNPYLYVLANPINYIDPSGYCASDDKACWEKAKEIVSAFPNIRINLGVSALTTCKGQWWSRHWTKEELEQLQTGLEGILYAFDNNLIAFENAFGTVTFSRQWSQGSNLAMVRQFSTPDYIIIFDKGASRNDLADTIIHEMGHLLDMREWRKSLWQAPWHWQFLEKTNSTCTGLTTIGCLIDYQPSGVTTLYGKTDISEDFADSFFIWVISKANHIVNSRFFIDYAPENVDNTRLNYIEGVTNYYKR